MCVCVLSLEINLSVYRAWLRLHSQPSVSHRPGTASPTSPATTRRPPLLPHPQCYLRQWNMDTDMVGGAAANPSNAIGRHGISCSRMRMDGLWTSFICLFVCLIVMDNAEISMTGFRITSHIHHTSHRHAASRVSRSGAVMHNAVPLGHDATLTCAVYMLIYIYISRTRYHC